MATKISIIWACKLGMQMHMQIEMQMCYVYWLCKAVCKLKCKFVMQRRMQIANVNGRKTPIGLHRQFVREVVGRQLG